jgi:diguanylate cyclase (GGDEF)-like protein
VLNVVLGRLAISQGDGGSLMVNADLVTMVVITAAMASLSHAVGSAWRNAERRARFLAETDPLTGIWNRRVFLERLEGLAADPRQEFALLMLDLDDFKRLNDEHGHIHGDDVLANVAGLLSENVRANDWIARYGGEEFVVAMPDTGHHEAVAVAERLRRSVLESTPTSISVGCAVRDAGESAASLLKRADDFLLVAKRNGKNAVRASALKRTA